ncbi:hypothetical protein SAT01_14570 [Sinomonas atrocyanea]|nr:hypothetical protein SAT01_14570 [Sinomonas atrocyanea]GGG76511.1 hypothetical protein GCM10007172_31740 [Sinomonas atrocyanea]
MPAGLLREEAGVGRELHARNGLASLHCMENTATYIKTGSSQSCRAFTVNGIRRFMRDGGEKFRRTHGKRSGMDL